MQRYYFELACLFALPVSVHFLSKLCSSMSLLPPHHTSASGSLPVSGITISSVQLLSHVRLFVTPFIVAPRPPCPSWTPGVHPYRCPLSGDAIQPSHPLSSPSPPAFNTSQHQSLFQWVNSLHEVAKVLEFQLQHQSFQWTLRTDLL